MSNFANGLYNEVRSDLEKLTDQKWAATSESIQIVCFRCQRAGIAKWLDLGSDHRHFQLQRGFGHYFDPMTNERWPACTDCLRKIYL